MPLHCFKFLYSHWPPVHHAASIPPVIAALLPCRRGHWHSSSDLDRTTVAKLCSLCRPVTGECS